MNESLDKKISIVKGTVTQAGYEQAICTFIKADENRKDIPALMELEPLNG